MIFNETGNSLLKVWFISYEEIFLPQKTLWPRLVQFWVIQIKNTNIKRFMIFLPLKWEKCNVNIRYLKIPRISLLVLHKSSYDKLHVKHGFWNTTKKFGEHDFFPNCWSILVYIQLKNCFHVTSYWFETTYSALFVI